MTGEAQLARRRAPVQQPSFLATGPTGIGAICVLPAYRSVLGATVVLLLMRYFSGLHYHSAVLVLACTCACVRVHVGSRPPSPSYVFCARFQRVIFQRAPASSSPCPRLVLASGTAPRRAAWRRRRRCAAHAAGGRGGGVGRGWRDRMGHRVINSFPFTPLFCIEPAVTLHRGCCGTGT